MLCGLGGRTLAVTALVTFPICLPFVLTFLVMTLGHTPLGSVLLANLHIAYIGLTFSCLLALLGAVWLSPAGSPDLAVGRRCADGRRSPLPHVGPVRRGWTRCGVSASGRCAGQPGGRDAGRPPRSTAPSASSASRCASVMPVRPVISRRS